MTKLSNPRTSALINNWPSGHKRVTAIFTVETSNRKPYGQRISRTTTGRPKKTTYYKQILIVDGDDERVYLIARTKYDQVILIDGTLKHHTYIDHELEMRVEIIELFAQYAQSVVDAAAVAHFTTECSCPMVGVMTNVDCPLHGDRAVTHETNS